MDYYFTNFTWIIISWILHELLFLRCFWPSSGDQLIAVTFPGSFQKMKSRGKSPVWWELVTGFRQQIPFGFTGTGPWHHWFWLVWKLLSGWKPQVRLLSKVHRRCVRPMCPKGKMQIFLNSRFCLSLFFIKPSRKVKIGVMGVWQDSASSSAWSCSKKLPCYWTLVLTLITSLTLLQLKLSPYIPAGHVAASWGKCSFISWKLICWFN